MIKYILIGFIIALFGCDSPKKHIPIIEKKAIGLHEKFVFKSFNNGVEVYLRSDFSFINRCYSRACLGGFRDKIVIGKYSISDNQITFMPEKMIWRENFRAFASDTSLVFDTVPYYESDSTKIQSEYWLVKSDSLKFLVSKAKFNERDELYYMSSNFISLANLYNSNIKQFANHYLLSNKDTFMNFRELKIMDDIPKELKDYFLDKEIEGKVEKVKVVKIDNMLIPRYSIKSEGGIKIGMKLYSDKYPLNPITIVKVDDNKCIGEGDDLFFENKKLKTATILHTMSNEEAEIK